VHRDWTELVTQQIFVFIMIPLEVGFTNRYYSFTSFFVLNHALLFRKNVFFYYGSSIGAVKQNWLDIFND
jgi:uncharacterized membrane protein